MNDAYQTSSRKTAEKLPCHGNIIMCDRWSTAIAKYAWWMVYTNVDHDQTWPTTLSTDQLLVHSCSASLRPSYTSSSASRKQLTVIHIAAYNWRCHCNQTEVNTMPHVDRLLPHVYVVVIIVIDRLNAIKNRRRKSINRPIVCESRRLYVYKCEFRLFCNHKAFNGFTYLSV